MNTVEVGHQCEILVGKYLEKNGYSILHRNFRCREGEIDIIASKDEVLCAVEVKKIPSSWDISDISLKIDFRKQLKIKKTLSYYLAHNYDKKYHKIRFDAAAVQNGSVTYWEGAF